MVEGTHFPLKRTGCQAALIILANDLLERAFDGSAMKLVRQALATKKASAEELSQIIDLKKKITAHFGRF